MEEHVSHRDDEFIWTKELSVELIRRFREKSTLWDMKSSSFWNKSIKKKAWDEIGMALNTTGAECKHKMSNILTSFRRARSELRKKLANGSTYKSRWYAFKELLFLLNRNTKENASENSDNGAEASSSLNGSDFNFTGEETFFLLDDQSNDLEADPLSDDDESLERDLDVVTTMIESASNKDNIESEPLVITIPGSSQQTLTNEPSSLRETTVQQNDSYRHEEITTFTAFIEAKMKRYSSETLHVVQKEIFDILYKADFNGFENNTSSDVGQSNSRKRKHTGDK